MEDTRASGSARTCRHYFVSGRVQGVFYRASTEETARKLGLSGWVRNLADGRVELVACGDRRQVELMEAWLGKGPAGAQVERVDVAELEDPPVFADFRIRY